METQMITLDREEAARLWRKYREHRAYSRPIDLEIEQLYRLIAKGKVIIKALESIVKAGLGDDGLPKLALARADAEKCYCSLWLNGAARMSVEQWVTGRTASSRYFDFPTQTFTVPEKGRTRGEAVVPHIPPDIRPARGIQNYHILFEAVWRPTPPVDPLLLRRIGKGDTWLVVGAWDLTEVERAAMAGRIRP